MTTSGTLSYPGFSVQVFTPIIQGDDFIGSLQNRITGYSHEILARGGFWSGDLTFIGTLEEVEDWFELGLGRRVVVIDQDQTVVFEGFIDQISVNAGSITEIRGPLLDIGNRVSVIYTPLNVDVYPPISGTQTTTIIVEDLNSQRRYGIIEKVLSVGKVTKTAAEKIRDLYLEENAEPRRTSQISITPGSSRNAEVRLSLMGYIHWTKVYPYISIVPGFSTVSDKIKAILSSDPNGIFSLDQTHIGTNSFLIPTQDGDGKTAWDVLTGLLNIGNATTDESMNFGCYADNIVYYSPIPVAVDYLHALGDNHQRITRIDDRLIVYPWQVLPGKWLDVTDFLVGSQQSTSNLKTNERIKFLESIRYSMPWSVDLSGGKTDRLAQLLSKITYTGGSW